MSIKVKLIIHMALIEDFGTLGPISVTQQQVSDGIGSKKNIRASVLQIYRGHIQFTSTVYLKLYLKLYLPTYF